jgi:hypothetical protein
MSEPDPTVKPAGGKPATKAWVVSVAGVLALCVLLFAAFSSGDNTEPTVPAVSQRPRETKATATPAAHKAEIVQVSDPDTRAPRKEKSPVENAAGGKSVQGAYGWKADTIYRFRFEKRVSVSRRHEAKPPSRRDSLQKGILVFEIQRIEKDGTAKGSLRLDSPHLKLPPFLVFDRETSRTRENTDRHRKLRVALEESLRAARWHVTLEGNGRVHVTQREPHDLRRWLEDAVAAGRWSKRAHARFGRMLSEHLEMWGQQEDDRLFIAVGGDGSAGRSTSPLDALRPRRSIDERAPQENGRYTLHFKHVPAESAKMEDDIRVPLLNRKERPVRIRVKRISGEGKAVFDEKLRMIDRLEEDYEVSMSCACGNRKLAQRVKVSNRLRRIAPPLREKKKPNDEEAGATP